MPSTCAWHATYIPLALAPLYMHMLRLCAEKKLIILEIEQAISLHLKKVFDTVYMFVCGVIMQMIFVLME
jgi:hypothetical protein